MSIASLAREEVRGLKPYEAAAQVEGAVRLNANEAHWNTSDGFRRPLNRYPEVRPARLCRLLADHYDRGVEEILVTRGSSEAIDLLIRSFCRPGTDNIVMPAPTFSMYRHYARIQGAEIREIPLDRERSFAIDDRALLGACDQNTKLVFLCSPNNPTGTTIPENTVRGILAGRANQSIVIVDEAYVEFSDASSTTALLDEFDNLVVLRTLSKALAFAGARCGAVIGNPGIVALLNAVQAPYAIATPVVECIEDALSSERLAEAVSHVDETVRQRQRLAAEVCKFSFIQQVWPSDANFFLVQADNVDAILDAAAKDKVLLRHFGGELADCLRITVGSADENACLLSVLKSVEESAGG